MFESNLLTQVNVHTPLPTFVETHLVSVLDQSMHDAFLFAHVMLGDRYERLATLLPFSSEIFYSIWGVLQWKLLQKLDAPFSENIFGLKRSRMVTSAVSMSPPRPGVPVATSDEGAVGATAAGSDSVARESSLMTFAPLGPRQRFVVWLSLVVYPYVKRWLRIRYEKLSAGTPDAEQERQALERRYGLWMKLLNVLVERLYPVFHVACEGSSYAFLLAFLLEKSPYVSAWQWLHGIVTKRTTLTDQLKAQSKPGAMRIVLVTQVILLVTIMGFRFLQWRPAGGGGGGGRRVTAASEESSAEVRVPRPAVDLSPAADCRAVEPGVCPVCERSVTNPAVNAASGVVGCYPCLQQFVAEHGTCPVTRKLSITQHIRRLFEM